MALNPGNKIQFLPVFMTGFCTSFPVGLEFCLLRETPEMYEERCKYGDRLLAASFSQDFVHQQEVTYEHTSKPAMLVAGHKMQKFCTAIGNLKSDNAPNLKGYRPPNECNDYLVPITLNEYET